MKLNIFSFKNITYFKKIIIQNSIRFVNYSVIDHKLLNKTIYDVGKVTRAHPTLHGHFAPTYLVGNNMLRAYLFFIYELTKIIFWINFITDIISCLLKHLSEIIFIWSKGFTTCYVFTIFGQEYIVHYLGYFL